MNPKHILLFCAVATLGVAVGYSLGYSRGEPGVEESSGETPSVEKPTPVAFDNEDALRSEIDRLQRGNRALIAELARERTRTTSEGAASAADPESSEFEAFRDALVDGDWSVPTLTAEEIESVLEAEGRSPHFLMVAAQLSDDPEVALKYVEESLEKAPDSPSILARAATWLSGLDDPPDRVDDVVDHLREVDPGNSFGSYLSAHRLFQAGEPERALELLTEAGVRSQFDTYTTPTIATTEQFYATAGHSPVSSRLAATFGHRLDYLMPLRGLSDSLTVHLEALSGPNGDSESLALLQRGSLLGERLSTGGRTFLDELVGMGVQAEALEKEREIRQRLGDTDRIGWIDEHLDNNQRRREEVRNLAGRLPEIVATMTQEQFLGYLSSVIKNGELVALREHLSRAAGQ